MAHVKIMLCKKAKPSSGFQSPKQNPCRTRTQPQAVKRGQGDVPLALGERTAYRVG